MSTTISVCWRARLPWRGPAGVTFTTVPLDLNRDLEAALDGPIDLVTTSALLDLVSEAWLDRLAVETLARSIPVYAALSYDGRIEISPTNPFDAAIVAAVNAHQRRDKGFGPALGPTAADAAIARFESLGCSVIHGQADWVVGPHDREFQMEIFSGWASAAREIGDLSLADTVGWLTWRRDAVAAGTFINSRRSCRYFRAADRHTLSRQVAVEQYLVVELMGAYRQAQSLIGPLDRGQDEACTSGGAKDDRCDHHMQTVEATGSEEAGYCVGPALDEDAA